MKYTRNSRDSTIFFMYEDSYTVLHCLRFIVHKQSECDFIQCELIIYEDKTSCNNVLYVRFTAA